MNRSAAKRSSSAVCAFAPESSMWRHLVLRDRLLRECNEARIVADRIPGRIEREQRGRYAARNLEQFGQHCDRSVAVAFLRKNLCERDLGGCGFVRIVAADVNLVLR